MKNLKVMPDILQVNLKSFNLKLSIKITGSIHTKIFVSKIIKTLILVRFGCLHYTNNVPRKSIINKIKIHQFVITNSRVSVITFSSMQ